jgi:hypothetical protein
MDDHFPPDDAPDLSRWSVPLDEELPPPVAPPAAPPPAPLAADDEPPVEFRFPVDPEPYPTEGYQPRLDRFGGK